MSGSWVSEHEGIYLTEITFFLHQCETVLIVSLDSDLTEAGDSPWAGVGAPHLVLSFQGLSHHHKGLRKLLGSQVGTEPVAAPRVSQWVQVDCLVLGIPLIKGHGEYFTQGLHQAELVGEYLVDPLEIETIDDGLYQWAIMVAPKTGWTWSYLI